MPSTLFIDRWRASAAAERANYQLFLSELCDYLSVPRPEPSLAASSANTYVFEHPVSFTHLDGSTSTRFIDLYKRGCFVLEAKQGSSENADTLFVKPARRGTATRGTSGWDAAMLSARHQAEQYAKSLPASEGWPPFLVVVDIGYSIELFADFSGTGKAYVPFPDSLNHRIAMDELAAPEIQSRLRAVWLDPLSLDPTRRSARVTLGVANQLAALARDLERNYPPERVSAFLMRCIFTFFAEDIHLLPPRSFTALLDSLETDLPSLPPMLESLWRAMDKGDYFPHAAFKQHLLRFNGGLFESVEALPLNAAQFELLRGAARFDWQFVEPAIFGTLLERALDPSERHRLGAHYTPRVYVERLVIPAIVEPLREDWRDTQTAAFSLERAGKTAEAIELLKSFHRMLCGLRVLDPACGSGNFLYVTLEHLKRLEGEVLDALEGLGEFQQSLRETGGTVDPHQLLGIELNPRAAAITDMVLWIGYIQWYFRTWGAESAPPEPVIKKFHNIESRDALLAFDPPIPVTNETGDPVTEWDGVTTKTHSVTGEEVPDEAARRTVLRYPNARRAEWPPADFIVGNPPFLGNWRMRGELGRGYTEALRSVYHEVPETADFVMFWWHRAAERVREGAARRFGFITTNTIRQAFQRRVMEPHLAETKSPLSLVFAIPDHPWVDAANGAAVRIAMTVARGGTHDGRLLRVVAEQPGEKENASRVEFADRVGMIHSDLSIGPNTVSAVPLLANQFLSCPGVKLHGAGFIVSPAEATELGLGRIPGLENHIRPYRNGRDLTGTPRGVMVIDLFGLGVDEVRSRFPEVYQWLLHRVKPEREARRGITKDSTEYANRWWLFGKTRSAFRPALYGLNRYIATVETAKHRIFQFLDESILPDNMLVNVASSDAYVLGVLSSRSHAVWALAVGGRLGYGNDPRYNKTRCFEPFPFPAASEVARRKIADLAESIDLHRKRQQATFPHLTLTGIYNALELLRSGETLDANNRKIHDDGLIAVLLHLHNELDMAVAEAYGWPVDLPPEDILYKLVELNAARAAEERRGKIRWLRPEYQNIAAAQTGIDIEEEAPSPATAKIQKIQWPAELPERVRAVRDSLRGGVGSAESVSRRFSRARVAEVTAILETLVALGQADRTQSIYSTRA